MSSADVRRLLQLEQSMYVSLWRWAARRPRHGSGEAPHAYAGMPTPIIWVFVAVSAIEIPVLHLILPWTWAQVTALVIGVWGLVWMFGLLASYHQHPHALDSERLRVRQGAVIDVAVPCSTIARATTREESLPSSSRAVQPVEDDDGTRLRIGVSGRVNVHVQLSRPTELDVRGEPMTVTAVSLWADEPRALVTQLRERITTA
ncbi:hypothetical protein KLP28_05855 [Nocardioidaceae bacterium]|nr:hypothetical protein KLP28_05855 [Nocardioidaceae bacterium]